MSTSVARSQRFNSNSPCPVCGGYEKHKRDSGRRCAGFLSTDEKWCHCTSSQYAGSLTRNDRSGTFAHHLGGNCNCGTSHDPAPPARVAAFRQRSERDAESSIKPVPQPGTTVSPAKSRILEVYEYRNEAGALLYEVARYEPKDFRQRQPDGKGGYIWNMKDMRRVLYRLPELLKADPSLLVFIPEGEKDVNRLCDCGLVSTTNVGGAGKWRTEDSEFLVGRQVVLLPDNDDVGRRHAELIARVLHKTAAGVRILSLPEVGETGDVSDWLDAGHGVDELLRRAGESPLWVPIDTPLTAPPALRLIPGGASLESGDRGDVDDADAHPSDYGNARRLVANFGTDIRYCYDWVRWLVWTGTHWQTDRTGALDRIAKKTALQIYKEVAVMEEDTARKAHLKHAKYSESGTALREMVRLAQSEPVVPVEAKHLDANPHFLNCPNGTLDLLTGELRDHCRADLITRVVPAHYDPEARCPMWEDFMHRIMNGNEDLIGFIRRAVGYTLTGDIRERCFFILHGTGANGKSVFLETLRNVLGDEYSIRTPTETLMYKRSDGGVPNDVARLKGARFVSASETDEGKRLAEARIKDMTGGDTISARFMRAEFFDFKPEFKIWLSTNHKPDIRGTDKGIWDRIRLIPFHVRIPEAEQDNKLAQKLLTELPGILAWAVRGCMEWQKDGLGMPAEVRVATADYQAEMDTFANFFADCCVAHAEARVAIKDLYEAHQSWCEENGERHAIQKSQKEFSMKLAERGFVKKRSGAGGTVVWYGVGLSTTTVA